MKFSFIRLFILHHINKSKCKGNCCIILTSQCILKLIKKDLLVDMHIEIRSYFLRVWLISLLCSLFGIMRSSLPELVEMNYVSLEDRDYSKKKYTTKEQSKLVGFHSIKCFVILIKFSMFLVCLCFFFLCFLFA